MIFLTRKEKKIPEILKSFSEIEGELSENEALGLYLITRKLPSKGTVLEIGSWKGKSTFCIACGLKKGKVIAMDPFNADAGNDAGSKHEYLQKNSSEDRLHIFKRNMEYRGVMDKIIIKKGPSAQFQNETSPIDFLFIANGQSIEGCKADFEMYAPKIKSGGYLAFQDYQEDRPELGSTFVIQHILPNFNEYRFYKSFDSLWVAKKS